MIETEKKHPHRKKKQTKGVPSKKKNRGVFPPSFCDVIECLFQIWGRKFLSFASGRGRADENKRYESEMDEQKSSLMAVSSSPYSYENQSILVLVFFSFP